MQYIGLTWHLKSHFDGAKAISHRSSFWSYSEIQSSSYSSLPLPSLSLSAFFPPLSSLLDFISAAMRISTPMCVMASLCARVCVCSWMAGQGLWTLRPGWRIERPLEAPWKPLQPALTPSRGRGAREGRSKLERGGQEVDVKSERSGEHLQSKEVSVVSAEFLKGSVQRAKRHQNQGRVCCCEMSSTPEKRTETSPWGSMPGPIAPSSCDGRVALKVITLEMLSESCWNLESWTWCHREKYCKPSFDCVNFLFSVLLTVSL